MKIAARRRPNLSTNEPENGDISNPGIAVSVTARPALDALWVSCNVIHGMSKNTIDPDMDEVKAVNSSKMNGAIRTLLAFWVNIWFSLTQEAYFGW
jgi:hypothetical protein